MTSPGKKRNCKKATSYSCGRSCININRICRIEGLKGQSVDIASKLKSAISASKSEPTAKAKQEAESKAKAKQAADDKAKAEAKAKQEADDKAKAKQEAEEKSKAEAKAKQEAEVKAKQEAEEKAKAKAKQEADDKAKAEAEAKAKQEAQDKAKQEAEAKAKQEAEDKAKQEAEDKAKQEAEAKAKAEAEDSDEPSENSPETNDSSDNDKTYPSGATVAKDAEYLGGGIEGDVYRIGDEAVKYILTSEDPNANESPETRLAGYKEGLKLQDKVASLGLAPKVTKKPYLERTEGQGTYIVFGMEMLDGYEEGYAIPEDVSPLSKAGRKIKTEFDSKLVDGVLTLQDNDIYIEDIHSGNYMTRESDKSFQFVDLADGLEDAQGSEAQMLEQLIDVQAAFRPEVAKAAESMVKEKGTKEEKRQYKKILKDYRRANLLDSDGNYDHASVRSEVSTLLREVAKR